MTSFIAVAADLLVAVLLVASIATSVTLSRRMARMKANEVAMRKTIGELVVATDSAERAISGLRATVLDSERVLAERLGAAARQTSQLAEQVSAGEVVISRVSQIAEMSRKLAAEEASRPRPSSEQARAPVAKTDPLRDTIMVARDVAARAARRLGERAA